MNYSKGKNLFFVLGLFLLLFVSSCKNEEDHTPCERPDCFVVSSTISEGGVVQQNFAQTYTTITGKKLLEETTWNILYANITVKVKNEYDNQARLITFYTTNIANGGSTTSKVTYEYDASDRLNKQIFYGNSNNQTGYTLSVYDGSQTKPTRTDYYNLQNEMTSHVEYQYDAANNLIEERDYQGTFFNSHTTYSNYTSDGKWLVKLYENFKENPSETGLNTTKTILTYEDCNVKSSAIEEDGVLVYTDTNTIENGLIVSSERIYAAATTPNWLSTYEYDCN